MLGTRSPVRPLALVDRDEALELCAQDLARNVFVAARIIEGAGSGVLGTVFGHRAEGRLTSVLWASANVVPVASTPESRRAFAERLRRWRSRSASVLGPREDVLDLWSHLEPVWGRPRALRARQPLLVATAPPSAHGVEPDPRVRLAHSDELNIVMPASVHMFTAEIGYPPYTGSDRAYRAAVGSLVARGRTYIVREGGEVIFKTDVGSMAFGHAQLQGVWLAPRLRGRGLSVPFLASVLEQLMIGPAPVVSLYVNDFNAPARAAYARLGFREVGDFATILL